MVFACICKDLPKGAKKCCDDDKGMTVEDNNIKCDDEVTTDFLCDTRSRYWRREDEFQLDETTKMVRIEAIHIHLPLAISRNLA